YMFPTPFSAELYGADDSLAYRRLPAADTVQYVLLPATIDTAAHQEVWDRESPAFTLVASNTWWRLYERTTTLARDVSG
ncbi:MAG: hypothetical protein AB7R77_22935, partial [Ilumatobacteraceae bacterium]